MDIELGLGKIKKLLLLLGNPERFLKVIHVAGTNGKGSVISYIYSILMKRGLKVGRYTSPAVFDELEIIQINGVNISKDEYDTYMEEIDAVVFKMDKEPSQFEKETALAILYFYRNNCDVCIVETGLGGSLDATNVFRKVLCSVITAVDYDHTAFLGESIEEIASAKAGIVKNYCPVVLAPQKHVEVYNIIRDKAEKGYSSVHCVSREAEYPGITPKCTATYQKENILTAIEVINILNCYEYNISSENITDGINDAYWPGRFEKISDNPKVYIDGAHNPNGAMALRETLTEQFKDKKLIFVMGIFADKDYKQVANIMAPMAEKIYTFTPTNERGLDGSILAKVVSEYNENVEPCETIEKALNKATTERDGVVVVFGSLSYLKDVKGYFLDDNR